jgi:hypothetical protein
MEKENDAENFFNFFIGMGSDVFEVGKYECYLCSVAGRWKASVPRKLSPTASSGPSNEMREAVRLSHCR